MSGSFTIDASLKNMKRSKKQSAETIAKAMMIPTAIEAGNNPTSIAILQINSVMATITVENERDFKSVDEYVREVYQAIARKIVAASSEKRYANQYDAFDVAFEINAGSSSTKSQAKNRASVLLCTPIARLLRLLRSCCTEAIGLALRCFGGLGGLGGSRASGRRPLYSHFAHSHDIAYLILSATVLAS